MSIIRKEYTLFLLGTINKELSSCLTDFVSLAKQKKPPAPPPHTHFFNEQHDQAGWNNYQKYMKNKHRFYILFQVL